MKKTIAFISQKGGVGKSTLAQAFATEMTYSGLKVLLADCDPQQLNSLDWTQIRAANKIEPPVACRAFATIEEALSFNSTQYDLLVIDGPARVSTGTLKAAQQADLIIQPTGASRFDLVPAFREFNSLSKKGISKEKLWLAITRISNDSEFTFIGDSCKASAMNYFHSFVLEKASYKQTSNKGKAITENSFESLQQQSFKLIKEITNKLYEKD